MARLKGVKQGLMMLVVDFDKQLEAGSFEHALCHMVDRGLDLTGLISRIRNDDGGAPAYDPAVLIKIVLLASAGASSAAARWRLPAATT